MEKQAIVKPGLTPSVVSGKASCMIKNGEAYSAGEKPISTADEKRLAKQLESLYNTGSDATRTSR
jgi:hypothetical protein